MRGGKRSFLGGAELLLLSFLTCFFLLQDERGPESRARSRKNDDDDQLIISSLNSIMTVFLLETEKKGRAVEDECV